MTDAPERRTTIDHEVVRQWVENRGGQPAAVADDAPDEAGILRIRFPRDETGTDDEDGSEGGLPVEPIDWPDFFERFEDQELALVYRETDGAAEDSADSTLSRWYEFEDRVFAGEF